MATKEDILKALNDSEEHIQIVIHYKNVKNGEPFCGIQFGPWKCLEDMKFDRHEQIDVVKEILHKAIEMN